jgi:hypothetical protein
MVQPKSFQPFLDFFEKPSCQGFLFSKPFFELAHHFVGQMLKNTIQVVSFADYGNGLSWPEQLWGDRR